MKKFSLCMLLAVACVAQVFAYKKTNVTVKSASNNSDVVVFVPDQLPDNCPLMIVTHGMNQDPEYQYGSDHMYELIDTEKFVVCYPRSNSKSWDIGGTGDMDFILKTIDKMADVYGIDKNRVYWSGFSMGSMLIYHCMPKVFDKIAAFAPTSGIKFGEPWTECKHPVNLIHCHAYDDDVFPLSQYDIRSYVLHFKDLDKCTGYKKTTNYRINGSWYTADKEVWSGGENGSEVELLMYNNGGHWPMGDNRFEIWNFCRRFSLDPGIPSGTLEFPKEGQGFTRVDTIDVRVNATDVDGYVTSIALYVDNSLKEKVTFDEGEKECALNYKWTRPTKGSHTLKAVITDNEGKLRELAKTVEIGEATPVEIIEAQPEENSFDLPLSLRSFTYTFNHPVNLKRLTAYVKNGGSSTKLTLGIEGYAATVTITLPDSVELKEGGCTVTLSSITDIRGVTLSMQTFHYTYGFTELNDNPKDKSTAQVVKRAFAAAFTAAKELYEKTSDEIYASTESMREPLKAVIDKYVDFASTSPTEYAAATQELLDAVPTLQARVELLDEYFGWRKKVKDVIDFFADNPDYNTMSNYTRLVTAYNSSLTDLNEVTIQRESSIRSAINYLERYLNQFLKSSGVDISAVGNVSRDQSIRVRYYDLQGRQLVQPLSHGVTIVRTTDSNGKVRTSKVLK